MDYGKWWMLWSILGNAIFAGCSWKLFSQTQSDNQAYLKKKAAFFPERKSRKMIISNCEALRP